MCLRIKPSERDGIATLVKLGSNVSDKRWAVLIKVRWKYEIFPFKQKVHSKSQLTALRLLFVVRSF